MIMEAGFLNFIFNFEHNSDVLYQNIQTRMLNQFTYDYVKL